MSKNIIDTTIQPQYISYNHNFHVLHSTVSIFNSLPSTHEYIKKNIASLPQGIAIISKEQTQGRGRLGKQWFSKKNKSLALSIAHHTALCLQKIPLLSLFMSIAVIRFLKKYMQGLSVKWPNDVQVYGKKICGILCELQREKGGNVVIIGIGCNIQEKEEDFPIHIKDNITSLYLQTQKIYPVEELILDILINIDDVLLLVQQGDFSALINEWRHYWYDKNRQVTFFKSQQKYSGKLIDIDEHSGNLLIKTENEIVVLSAGEISFNSVPYEL